MMLANPEPGLVKLIDALVKITTIDQADYGNWIRDNLGRINVAIASAVANEGLASHEICGFARALYVDERSRR